MMTGGVQLTVAEQPVQCMAPTDGRRTRAVEGRRLEGQCAEHRRPQAQDDGRLQADRHDKQAARQAPPQQPAAAPACAGVTLSRLGESVQAAAAQVG